MYIFKKRSFFPIKQISFDDELSILALAILITTMTTTNLLIIYSMLGPVLGSLHLILSIESHFIFM